MIAKKAVVLLTDAGFCMVDTIILFGEDEVLGEKMTGNMGSSSPSLPPGEVLVPDS